MTLLQAVLLGMLQGLTEFLPVSSSGHLVMGEFVLGITIPERDLLGFDILLHAGTALALLMVYWRLWWDMILSPLRKDSDSSRLLFHLVLATIPAAVAGVLFGDAIAENLRTPLSVGIAFLGTAALLLSTIWAQGRRPLKQSTWQSALAMGCMQIVALIPGISRSGSTIAAGQWSGFSRSGALDFSFLMALPIILGAMVLTFKDVWSGEVMLPSLEVSLSGFLTSFVVSVGAIYTLRWFVRQYGLAWFSAYLGGIGFLVILLGR